MKHFSSIFLGLALLFSTALYVARPVSAQSSGMPIILGTQAAVSGCAWPTAYATVTNGLALCPLNLTTGPALAIAVNGGAFVAIPMSAAAAGVTSFNGRTGAVVSVAADYSYAQLSGLPTTTGTCTGGSLTVGDALTTSTSGITFPVTAVNFTGCPF